LLDPREIRATVKDKIWRGVRLLCDSLIKLIRVSDNDVDEII